MTPLTTKIYTLSLHDALPISGALPHRGRGGRGARVDPVPLRPRRRKRRGRSQRGREDGQDHRRAPGARAAIDRKSTRLNSSHTVISYAVFCLKKKKKMTTTNK